MTSLVTFTGFGQVVFQVLFRGFDSLLSCPLLSLFFLPQLIPLRSFKSMTRKAPSSLPIVQACQISEGPTGPLFVPLSLQKGGCKSGSEAAFFFKSVLFFSVSLCMCLFCSVLKETGLDYNNQETIAVPAHSNCFLYSSLSK